MLMGSRVWFQNSSGASQQNRVAASSLKTRVDGDVKQQQQQQQQKHKMAPYSPPGVIQVSGSPEITNWFEKRFFYSLFKGALGVGEEIQTLNLMIYNIIK